MISHHYYKWIDGQIESDNNNVSHLERALSVNLDNNDAESKDNDAPTVGVKISQVEIGLMNGDSTSEDSFTADNSDCGIDDGDKTTTARESKHKDTAKSKTDTIANTSNKMDFVPVSVDIQLSTSVSSQIHGFAE